MKDRVFLELFLTFSHEIYHVLYQMERDKDVEKYNQANYDVFLEKSILAR